MVCQHLRDIELAITAAGLAATFRGRAWTNNCREWVFFDCLLDAPAIRASFNLSPCVVDHTNDDLKSGRESGFVCESCNDAIIGLHPLDGAGKTTFPTARG
jgi:hypothetical protein